MTWRRSLDKALQSGKAGHREEQIDGRVFSFVIAPISDGGYANLYASDITKHKESEQRQAQLFEQLETTNRELKDFAHIVSHDLKAPLRAVDVLVDWLVTDYADKFDDQGKEQIRLLKSRVNRMHGLIEGILQYSRIGRAGEEDRVRVDLNTLLPEIIDAIAPPNHIEIVVENKMPMITCDQTRITQIFQNLISNAVKYMDKPQGLVRINCTEQADVWEFSVSDNGPGIEQRYFEQIFKMFQTLTPRDAYESTGVGLTLVKKIVKQYGGKVWVESELGVGSTFFFTLPKQRMEMTDEKQPTCVVS